MIIPGKNNPSWLSPELGASVKIFVPQSKPRTSTELQQRRLCRLKLVAKENWTRNRGGGSSSLPSAVRVISLTFLWCIVETIKMFADCIVIGWCWGRKKKEKEMLLGCIKYLITLATPEGFIVIQFHRETPAKNKLPWSWINPWPLRDKKIWSALQ